MAMDDATVELGLLQQVLEETDSSPRSQPSQRAGALQLAMGLITVLALTVAMLAERGLVQPATEGALHSRLGTISLQSAPSVVEVPSGDCLCLFDVDRTLTSKQGQAASCPGSEAHPGVWDDAWGGGDLVLSPLGRDMSKTFCGQCHRGIISMGDVGSPKEKELVLAQFPNAGTVWSHPHYIVSPLVMGCADPQKPQCAKGIVDWYASAKQIHIAPQNVFFFDDATGNANGFAKFGYNAREVSCGSRDVGTGGHIGLCGAQLSEIVQEPGIYKCPA